MMWPLGNVSAWEGKEPGSGGHRDKGSTSFAAIWATLVPTVIFAAVYLVAFVLVRLPYRNIYAARTYFRTIPEKDRTPSSSRTPLSWWHDFRALDDKFILRHQSLDAYLFLRFFRLLIIISFVGVVVTWPVLFAVNATGGGDATQLDRISFSNVTGTKRLYAHAVVAWVYFSIIVLLVTRERLFAIGIRQAALTTKKYKSRLSSRIVLYLSVPLDAFKDEKREHYFGKDAVRTWKASKCTDLQSLVDERTDTVSQLESATLKFQKKIQEQGSSSPNGTIQSNGTDDNASKWASSPARPRHRLVSGGAKEVDSITYYRKQITDTAKKIDKMQHSQHGSATRHQGAIFVEFKDQASAHQAYQQIQHHSPFSFQPRFIGVQPKEVLWQNLTMDAAQRISYSYLAIALVAATIILWAIPIGIIGTISNIDYLTDKVKFLRFIDHLPKPILGFIKGFVPPYVLSYVISYVPYFFRDVAKKSGRVTTPEAERMVQIWYFAFQLIQVFLVTTFTSGAATVATKIANNPTSVPQLLAENLPKASNFYLAYFLIQGISTAANNVLNSSDLFKYIFFDKVFDQTPRQKYNRYIYMKGISWGSVYPKFANFAVIAIAYSCIAPLILGFATVGLYFYYISYRYNLLYVIQVKVEMKGSNYTRALQHVLVGVYVAELCLFGLFGLREASGPSIMMLVLILFTALYHYTTNRYLSTLETYTPLSIVADEESERPLLSTDEEEPHTEEEQQQSSTVHQLGRGIFPRRLLDPLVGLLEPRIFASHATLRPWLQDPAEDESSFHKYTDDEIKNAYTNPALTSKTPRIWLAKDERGVSKYEKGVNEEAELSCTDDGAHLTKHNHVVWNKSNFEEVPIFKKQILY